MLEEFMNVMTDSELNTVEEELKNAEVKNLIDGLEMFSNDPKMLTNAYTDILCNDNVVYLLTRISQHPIFMQHFPELYKKNENGESVINCQQNSPYHRYGVFRHILYTIEYVGKDNLKYSKQELKLLKWTMFLHDIGKPFAKTTNLDGKDSFAGHDEMSVEIATAILDRLYFTEQEKKIILTLIRYHDRYLNEGEVTFDNLSFLAQELENKKELFDMIIEVKTADNRAKSIAVYNKFLAIIPKYIDFEQEFFSTIEMEEDVVGLGVETDEKLKTLDELLYGTDEELISELDVESKEKEESNHVELTKELYDQIYQNILHGTNISYTYTPIIDIRGQNVMGYEIKSKLENNTDMKKVFEFAKEQGKFEKLNQLLALNLMENGLKTKKDKKTYLIVRIDLKSLVKYNNKARIYDITDKNNVLILLENYDYSNVTDINELCKEIKRARGMTGLANFQDSTFTTKELSKMEIDYIEYAYNKNTKEMESLIEYSLENAQKIWISSVETKKELKDVKTRNVQIISGKAIFKESSFPEITDGDVENLLKNM